MESGLKNADSAFPGGPITIPMDYPLDICIFWIQSYFAYEFGKKGQNVNENVGDDISEIYTRVLFDVP